MNSKVIASIVAGVAMLAATVQGVEAAARNAAAKPGPVQIRQTVCFTGSPIVPVRPAT